MIAGLAPCSNWHGARLVTHALHEEDRSPPGSETAFSECPISSFRGEGRLGPAVRSRTPVVLATLLE